MRGLTMPQVLDFPKAVPDAGRSAGVLWRTLGELLTRAVCNRVNAWMVRCTIDSLRSLDDRTLADIGMHRREIEFLVRRQMTRRC